MDLATFLRRRKSLERQNLPPRQYAEKVGELRERFIKTVTLETKIIPGLQCTREGCTAKVNSNTIGVLACQQGHDLHSEDFPDVLIERVTYLYGGWGVYAMKTHRTEPPSPEVLF